MGIEVNTTAGAPVPAVQEQAVPAESECPFTGGTPARMNRDW